MSLTPGQRLGPYEVIAAIGAGGMGEVYRARDTKLGRDVALKILPALFVTDPDRVARFQREAQVLASLNHPNIAIVHGLEEAGSGPATVRALVMELVEGPTLADRIAEGPIPMDEALPLARQITEALDAAHGQGIIHRDLKPANIKVRPDGTIKILDFGLAKAVGGGPSNPEGPYDGANVANSPTLTARATAMGMIIGTAAYMAPEQARGKSVDKRADIWAFGCVLFEMLTARRVFVGEDMTETLASVVKEQPNLDAAPAPVQRLIRKCLEKDPKKRLRDIGDVWELIAGSEDPASMAAGAAGSSNPAKVHPARAAVPWVVAALALVAAGALAVTHFGESQVAAPLVRFDLDWPVAPAAGSLGSAHFFQVSPDGRWIAIVSDNALWVRALDGLEAIRIERTQGVTYPFWAPDGGSVGFFQGGQLKVVARGGGAVRVVCDAPDGRGGAWSPRGIIVFSAQFGNGGLQQVPEQGGPPVSVTKVEAAGPTDDAHRYPQFLPDGDRFLYLHLTSKREVAGVYVASLGGSPPVRVLEGRDSGLYAQIGADGFLLTLRDDALVAQAFDLAALKVSGTPFVVATGVGQGENTGLGAFSVGGNGTLIHAGTASVLRDLIRVDRAGKPRATLAAGVLMSTFAVAPDERRIAMDISPENRNSEADIWVMAVGGSPSKFTFGPRPGWMFPVWSPKGDQIAYTTIDLAGQAGYEIRRKASNMAGVEEPLVRSTETIFLWDWSPDGKYLVYQNGGDLYQLPIEGDRKPVAFTKSPAEDQYGQVSPDGLWLAYSSGDRNQAEVFVQPIPPTGALWQVSKGGGTMPRWRRDGREMFYRAADGRLTALPVAAGADRTFVAGAAEVLFAVPMVGNVQRFTYAPSADGKQFVVGVPTAGAERPMTVVLNWHAAIQARGPS